MSLLFLLLISPTAIAIDSTAAGDEYALRLELRHTTVVSDSDLQSSGRNHSSAGLFGVAPMRLQLDNVERYDLAYDSGLLLLLTAERPEQGALPGIELGMLPRLQINSPLETRTLTWSDVSTYLSFRKSLPVGNLGLTLFPWHGQQIRVGFTEATAWASTAPTSAGTPGGRLEWSLPDGYGFVAGTAFARQMDQTNGTRAYGTAWQTVAGIGWHLWDLFWVDVQGSYALRGTIDKQELRTVENGRNNVEPWKAFGGAVRVGLSQGMPLATPISYVPLENDLFVTDSLIAAPASREMGLAWSLAATATAITQTLQDSAQANKVTWQRANASNLIAHLRSGRWNGKVLGSYRELAFILFSVPSNPSFMTFPEGVSVHAEKRIAASVAYDWRPLEIPITTALEGGILWPAAITAMRTVGDNTTSPTTQQTLVFHSTSSVDILNPGEQIEPVPEARLALRAPLGTWAMVAIELLDQVDANRRKLALGADGVPVRVKSRANRLGMNLLVRVAL